MERRGVRREGADRRRQGADGQPAHARSSSPPTTCRPTTTASETDAGAVAPAQDRGLHRAWSPPARCRPGPASPGSSTEAAAAGWTAGGRVDLGRAVGAGRARARRRRRAGRATSRSSPATSCRRKKPAPAIYLLARRRASACDPTRRRGRGQRATGCWPRSAPGCACVVTVSGYTGDEDFTGAALVVVSASATRTASRPRCSPIRYGVAPGRRRHARPTCDRACSTARTPTGETDDRHRASPTSSSSCAPSRRPPSTTRSTSATSTRSSATATSATRWPAASRSCSHDWDTYDRTDIGTFLQEDRGGHHLPDRRHLRADLGHRVPAGRRRRPRARPSSTATTSSRCCGPPIEGIKARGKAELGDKTLLDALVPVTDAIEAAVGRGADAGRDRPRPQRQPRREAAEATTQHAGQARPAPATPASAASARSTPARWPSPSSSSGSPTTGRPTDPPTIASTAAPHHPRHNDVEEPAMKKFVNDPQAVRPGDARGHRPGQPGHPEVRARVQPDHAGGRAERRTRCRSSRAPAPGTSRRT